MNRVEILNAAGEAIGGPRQRDYGDVRMGFERIAELWGAATGAIFTAEQVALMMVLVKVARLTNSPDHLDSWMDIAGYAALGGEVGTGSA